MTQQVCLAAAQLYRSQEPVKHSQACRIFLCTLLELRRWLMPPFRFFDCSALTPAVISNAVFRQNVIQQIAAEAFHPTLGNSTLPRTPQRSADTCDFHRSDRDGDFRPILGITIQEAEPRRRPKWKRFSQLLDDPHARRMLCGVDVQNAPTVVTDDERTVEDAERDRWNCEEVQRGDGFPMVSKEGEPAFDWLGIPRSSFRPTGDGLLGEIKTEHEEFAMNAGRFPGRALSDHPEDQFSNFLRCLFSPHLRTNRIVKSLDEVLDKPASDTVRTWRFKVTSSGKTTVLRSL